MSDGKNMVHGIAAAFCEVAARLTAELEDRRRIIIDRNYHGDEAAYNSWASAKFSSSGNHAEYAELQWLKAQTKPVPAFSQPDYPG